MALKKYSIKHHFYNFVFSAFSLVHYYIIHSYLPQYRTLVSLSSIGEGWGEVELELNTRLTDSIRRIYLSFE